MKITIIALAILCSFQLKAITQEFKEKDTNTNILSSNFIAENQDTSLILLSKYKEDFLKNDDTLKAIKCIIDLSIIYSNNANYSKSYDGFWEALILSDQINDDTYIGEIYDGLAMLYGLFYRNDLALDYFKKSLDSKKGLIDKGVMERSSLIDTYFLMTIHFRVLKNYGLAQSYLDSCKFLGKTRNPVNESPYFIAEQAYLLYHNGEFKNSEALLLKAEEGFQSTNRSYLVILYSFFGDLYDAMGLLTKSEEYYLKSLEVGQKYKSHQNFVPEVYDKLSKLYLKTKRYKKAYNFLDRAKNLNDSLFGARSINNSSLLEIKDEFRLNREKQQKLNETMQLSKLEQQKRILLLRNIILIVSFLSFLIISVIIYRNIKSKHRSEQLILKNNQLLTEQKNREILEIKNKELTSSALQLIEKDELLLDIKNRLINHKKSDSPIDPDSILNKIKTNSKKDWKEFEARFTSVNESFYKSLTQRFPSLTPGEQKLCALVKLNFSSKEMSQLLGISIESVHTSRYRLRKKLQLEKGDNLTEFMSQFG